MDNRGLPPQTSNSYCLPGKAGRTPIVLAMDWRRVIRCERRAKAPIVTEVERLQLADLEWKNEERRGKESIDRIPAVMHHFRDERDSGKSIAPSRKLWTALRALNRYLIGQSAWLVNYAERHRAGVRVGTAITEGTANFLVNRRMNKSQQMRWSRRGADLPLQVRCAVYNGARSVPSPDRDSIQPTTHSG